MFKIVAHKDDTGVKVCRCDTAADMPRTATEIAKKGIGIHSTCLAYDTMTVYFVNENGVWQEMGVSDNG